jgi:hypothetical protein
MKQRAASAVQSPECILEDLKDATFIQVQSDKSEWWSVMLACSSNGLFRYGHTSFCPYNRG